MKKLKKELLEEFQVLDCKLEERGIDLEERNRMKPITIELESIWRMEEMRARQRSRDRQIKEGDRNTAILWLWHIGEIGRKGLSG